jgi:anti-sigma factor RsiW
VADDDFKIVTLASPRPAPPEFEDQVRFWIAVGLMVGVAVFGLLLIGIVAAGWLTISDAKDLSVMIIALFGIVSPIIAFYFAARSNRDG